MELAAADEHLSTRAFGQMLLRRCALVSSASWVCHGSLWIAAPEGRLCSH